MFLASRYRFVLEVVLGVGGITCAPFPVFPLPRLFLSLPFISPTPVTLSGLSPLQSKFEVKSIAGNIVPAIATTNAIVAGLQVAAVNNPSCLLVGWLSVVSL